jgi:putative transposase
MAADFCVEVLAEALAKFGAPEIFNTDQGAQFTGSDIISVQRKHQIRISMDGKAAGATTSSLSGCGAR